MSNPTASFPSATSPLLAERQQTEPSAKSRAATSEIITWLLLGALLLLTFIAMFLANGGARILAIFSFLIEIVLLIALLYVFNLEHKSFHQIAQGAQAALGGLFHM